MRQESIADAPSATGLAKLREWAPVIGVVVAIVALCVTVAILASNALGRMETRLRADVVALRTEVADDFDTLRAKAATDKAEVLAQIESVRADVRAMRDELTPVGDISAILELLQESR